MIEAAAKCFMAMPMPSSRSTAQSFSSHEIAKLIGSPRDIWDTVKRHQCLTQENLDRMHTDELKLRSCCLTRSRKPRTVSGSYAGHPGKATLTLGDNRRVDFSRTMVILTSNLGAREMSELISGGIGFAPAKATKNINDTEVDQKIIGRG